MDMIELEQYLENPCRVSSIPYWKAEAISLPSGMRLLHQDEFDAALLEHFADEPYFRLYHDLKQLDQITIPMGFSLGMATISEFAAHINLCYPGASMTETELARYETHKVYDPQLWIVIRDDSTGQIVASAIGELDHQIGEGVLEWIQVSPEYRGIGLGQCIVKQLLHRMQNRASFATVSGKCNNPSNPEALYRKCGFAGNDVWHVLHKR